MKKIRKDNTDDDELMMQELRKQFGDSTAQKNDKATVMTQADWEREFDLRLKFELIDLPEGFYEEEMLFDEPEKLMDVFTHLEEQNLSSISKTQEIEQQLEIMK